MIPDKVTLRELMLPRTVSVDPKRHPDETFELFSIPAFDRRQTDITTGAEIGSSKQSVRPGDVLLSKIVPHIRRAWIVPDSIGHRQIASGEWIVFRGKQFHGSYLRHVLTSNAFHAEFMSTVAGVGGSLLRARPGHVASIEVPLPRLDEQRRIAAILDKADELRTKSRQAIARLEALTQSIFHSMFGGREVPWPQLTIDDLADRQRGAIRTGPFGSQLLTSEFTDQGIAVLGIDNAVSNEFTWGQRRYISEEKYEQLKRYTVNPGDLLVTIMGTLGRCAVVPADIPRAINTKHLCCITLDRSLVVPEWLHAYFLRSDAANKYLRQTTKGAIMGGLNMGIIKKMPVRVPPLELQQTFATRVAAVERLKETHRQHLAELDILFASLQHRAFKGEL